MRAIRTLALVLVALAALAARAESLKARHEKSLAPRPGGTLRVEAAFQDVTVTFSPAAKSVDVVVDLEVSLWPGDGKAYLAALAPTFEEKADRLVVRSRATGFRHVGMSNCRGTVAVTLPPGMALELDTGSGDIRVVGDSGGMPLAADTGSGDVVAAGRVQGFKADTGSGDIRARLEGPCGEVQVETGSGDVDFSGAAKVFKANTGSGEVRAAGLAGEARFDTGSGSVEASFASLPQTCRIAADTGSGEVALQLPRGATPSGRLETGSGTIRSDFPGTFNRREDVYTMAAAPGLELAVETGSGDITLIRLP